MCVFCVRMYEEMQCDQYNYTVFNVHLPKPGIYNEIVKYS